MRVIWLIGSVVFVGVAGMAVAGEQMALTPRHRSYLAMPNTCRTTVLPYLWQQSVGDKHLVVLGTHHDRDLRSPMYARLERALRQARPEVIIHEGVVPANLMTEPLPAAIERAADLGMTATLAPKLGARLRSGDAPARSEIEGLLNRHRTLDVFVFLVAQRFVGSDRHPDASSLERDYSSFVHDYLEGNRFPLVDEWRAWEGFRKAFLQVTGRSFSALDWDPELLNPTYRTGALSDVVRSSEDFRDASLVAAIQDELQQHDRVAVVFGCLHILAIQPELESVAHGTLAGGVPRP
jgi:hypothetical protein